jgi:hypothetical protein
MTVAPTGIPARRVAAAAAKTKNAFFRYALAFAARFPAYTFISPHFQQEVGL